MYNIKICATNIDIKFQRRLAKGIFSFVFFNSIIDILYVLIFQKSHLNIMYQNELIVKETTFKKYIKCYGLEYFLSTKSLFNHANCILD